MNVFSVAGFAREHLSLPGHDHAEGSQDDRGGEAGGPDPVRGSDQPAELHHGGQSDVPDVRAARKVTGFICTYERRARKLKSKAALTNRARVSQGREEPDAGAAAAAGRGVPGLSARRPGEGTQEKGGAGAKTAGGRGRTPDTPSRREEAEGERQTGHVDACLTDNMQEKEMMRI